MRTSAPILFILLTWIFFSACNNTKSPTEDTPLTESIEAYNTFLITFKDEVEKSIANQAETDEWESALQSLLLNAEAKNHEIQRQWKITKPAENSDYLTFWQKTELLRFEIEKMILQGWKDAENREFEEVLTQLSEADTEGEEENIRELRKRILASQLESDSLFSEAFRQLDFRKRELEKDAEGLKK